MSLTTNECVHGFRPHEFCKECSKVKMVVYKQDNSRVVWYNFLKENKKQTEILVQTMLSRFIRSKINDQHTNRILFYNQNGQLLKEI